MKALLVLFAMAIGIAVGLAIPAFHTSAEHQARTRYVGAHDAGGASTNELSDDGTYLDFEAIDVPFDPIDCPGQTFNINFSNVLVSKTIAGTHVFEASVEDLVTNDLFTVEGGFAIPGFTTGVIFVQGFPCSNTVLFAALLDGGIRGDVDCDNDVDAADSLKILRYIVGLSVTQNEPCGAIGA